MELSHEEVVDMPRPKRYNKSGPLKGGISNYRLDRQAQAFTPAEARAEYARLRREANRRLDVLRSRGMGNLEAVRNRPGEFAALDRNAAEREVRKSLADVARFLNLKTSSFQGARKSRRQFVESMQEAGYDWVNEANADEFGRFMGAVQKQKAAKGYDSEQIAELFHTAKEKRIDSKTLAEDFEFWLENQEALESAPRSGKIISSAEFAERLGLEL